MKQSFRRKNEGLKQLSTLANHLRKLFLIRLRSKRRNCWQNSPKIQEIALLRSQKSRKGIDFRIIRD